MKKIVLMIILILSLFIPNNVFSNSIIINDNHPEWYDNDGKIKVFYIWTQDKNIVITTTKETLKKDILQQTFYGADDTIVNGTIVYPNINNITFGKFDLQWIFTPDDSKYETKSDVFHFNVLDIEAQDNISSTKPTNTEELLSLTATSLIMSPKTTYDLNINNTEIGSSYSWKSSNTKVATVNAKTGLVTSKSKGNAKITCTVTTPDNKKTTLTSNVIVGLDEDNYPVLNADSLDLNIDDTFDLNVENQIKGCQYRYMSTDKSIAKVTSGTGIVTGLKKGTATIRCIISTKDGDIIVLKCDVDVN